MATTAIPFKAVRPRARAAADDPYRNRYLIALTVTLASILELLDTSIVNVAVPHMMGTLGATLDQIAWVSTGYVVANVIVLPITGWLSSRVSRPSNVGSLGGLVTPLAALVWLLGSVLAGARFGVPALYLPIAALPVGVLTANMLGHDDNELRVINWAIVLVVSLVLVSAGVWAWIRRQPR